ncbi:hypothetical protein C8R46DRAFT_1103312 [Mycena filopes]|nr:hypothetical protein C8R46DRAFT_1103312 [Mycena filopes]
MLSLYYTWDGVTLTNYLRYRDTPKHILFTSGEGVLSEYRSLLIELHRDCQTGSALRLQNALAASICGFTPEAFSAMSPEAIHDLREECGANRIFSWESAPPIVVFLGKDISDSDNDEPDSDEGVNEKPWHEDWDRPEGPWPCARWGWHVQQNAESSYLFISGAYVAWQDRWPNPDKWDSRIPAFQRLLIHLQITMFHELQHLARATIHDRLSQKVLDHLQHNDLPRGVSDGGHLAEILAFGGVVGLLLENDVVQLITSDPAVNSAHNYALSDKVLPLLFASPTPPINATVFKSPLRIQNMPEYARAQSQSACSESDSAESKLIVLEPAPEDFTAPTILSTPPLPHPSGLILLTGETAAYLHQHPEEFDRMKNCVIREDDWPCYDILEAA